MARTGGQDRGLFQRKGAWWVRRACPYGHEYMEKIGPTKFSAKAFYQPDALVSGELGLIGSLELKIGERRLGG